LFWILVVLAIAVGAYLAFGVMGIHRIRGKIDEALGKKPVTERRGDEGALMIHQERLRQEDIEREKAANEAMEAMNKIHSQTKTLRREITEAEGGKPAARAP
jgi:hypothetical protein